MKVIRVHVGTVAIRLPLDRKNSPANPPLLDLLSAIQQRYKFSVAPTLDAAQLNGPFNFQAGKFVVDGKAHAINQLVVLTDGDAVAMENTDLAEAMSNDLLNFLDETFGMDLQSLPQQRYYASAIIVEFGSHFDEQTEFIRAMEEIINSKAASSKGLKLNKISFAPESNVYPGNQIIGPLDSVARTEFTIERRGGEPFASHRYFCVAPMKTNDHLAALKQIGELSAGGKRRKGLN